MTHWTPTVCGPRDKVNRMVALQFQACDRYRSATVQQSRPICLMNMHTRFLHREPSVKLSHLSGRDAYVERRAGWRCRLRSRAKMSIEQSSTTGRGQLPFRGRTKMTARVRAILPLDWTSAALVPIGGHTRAGRPTRRDFSAPCVPPHDRSPAMGSRRRPSPSARPRRRETYEEAGRSSSIAGEGGW
jgi:hypothetical protein